MDFSLPAQREPANLRHHFTVGSMWLALSNGGESGVPLIYAAFEFRLQIERLGFYYLQALRGGQFNHRDKKKILPKYRNVEQEIRILVGNQLVVDRTFEFQRKLMRLLKVSDGFTTPNFREIIKCYDECSDACHVMLNITSIDKGVRQEQFQNLTQVQNYLHSIVISPIGFPIIKPGTWLHGIWQRFLAGQDIDAELVATAKREGLWATIDPGDGSERNFIGEAIHPQADSASELMQYVGLHNPATPTDQALSIDVPQAPTTR